MFTNSIRISPEDNIIDSRDFINRTCGLRTWQRYGNRLTTDERNELKSLDRISQSVHADREYASEWRHGVPVVNDSYFTEYALAFARDIGMPLDELDPAAIVADVRAGCRPLDYMGRTFWAHG